MASTLSQSQCVETVQQSMTTHWEYQQLYGIYRDIPIQWFHNKHNVMVDMGTTEQFAIGANAYVLHLIKVI